MIIVDQMRSSLFWPPASGISNVWTNTPSITQLMNQSYVFQNYFACATHCSPARSTLLTGLYTQQTCMFNTSSGNSSATPVLLPYAGSSWTQSNAGFPTIGNVLSQSLPVQGGGTGSYDTVWIGKWHVSCLTGVNDGSTGCQGPSQYGFTNPWNLPTTSTQYPMAAGILPAPTQGGFPSPNGFIAGGNGGDYLDSLQVSVNGLRDWPNWPQSNAGVSISGQYVQLNDSAIATAFADYWIKNQPANSTGSRWFCAVSFVNPHDIASFPWAAGLVGQSSPPACDQNIDPAPSWCTAQNPSPTGYQWPPVATTAMPYGSTESAICNPIPYPWCSYDTTTIAAYSNLYTSVPTGWNNADDPANNPYYNQNTQATGKPGYQAYFENNLNLSCGAMHNQSAWLVFLNYYMWLEACVDQQVKLVHDALSSSGFDNTTVIIFTSDHGEYEGSHNMHDKGGGVYDEGLNVPFMVSFPVQRGLITGHSAQTMPKWVPYCCSSVDVLPFLYSLALGNNSWRFYSDDMINYLSGREGMGDAIMNYPNWTPQHRLSSIPLAATGLSQTTQPYILSTTDEDNIAYIPGTQTAQPSHVVAYRTVDPTDKTAIPNSNGAYLFGGGKLGIYSFWDVCNPNPYNTTTGAPILPDQTPPQAPPGQVQQFEFYNYSQNPAYYTLTVNHGETGNQAFTGNGTLTLNAQAQHYLNDFMSVNVQNELYYPNLPLQLRQAVANAFCNYVEYLEDSTGYGCHSGESPACTDPDS